MESLAIHMVGINRLYFKTIEHVLDRKSLSTFLEHAPEHPAFRWNHLKAEKMLDIRKVRVSLARKTAHTFARDALVLNGAVYPRFCKLYCSLENFDRNLLLLDPRTPVFVYDFDCRCSGD